MESNGLSSLLKEAMKQKKTVSFDIAEINPKLDVDNQTVKLAAAFIVEIIDSVLSNFDHGGDHGDGSVGLFDPRNELNRPRLLSLDLMGVTNLN